MNKKEILTRLEESREEFLQAIEGLSDEELEQPGVMAGWSVKDILAHLSRWEAELIKLLWQAKQGDRPTSLHFKQPDVDKVNAEWHLEMRDRPLERVLEDFHGVRNQTIRRVEAFSDKDLADPKRYPWLGSQPLWEWIESDSFGHEAEHLPQILAWKEKR